MWNVRLNIVIEFQTPKKSASFWPVEIPLVAKEGFYLIEFVIYKLHYYSELEDLLCVCACARVRVFARALRYIWKALSLGIRTSEIYAAYVGRWVLRFSGILRSVYL